MDFKKLHKELLEKVTILDVSPNAKEMDNAKNLVQCVVKVNAKKDGETSTCPKTIVKDNTDYASQAEVEKDYETPDGNVFYLLAYHKPGSKQFVDKFGRELYWKPMGQCEALDVEDNGVEEATSTLVANGNKYEIRRTKQGMKNHIYGNVDTKGIFKDDYWQGYRKTLEQIKNLGYEVISGPANDAHHNNGYSLDGKEKAWDIQITNPETKIQLRGQIKAQAAGTVEDPLSAYDIVFILY